MDHSACDTCTFRYLECWNEIYQFMGDNFQQQSNVWPMLFIALKMTCQLSLTKTDFLRTKIQKVGFLRRPGFFSFFSLFTWKCCLSWAVIFAKAQCVNSLCPGDAIWRHKSGPTLDQVMACCLMAPSHYLNQCWLIIKGVLWHSPESNFTGNAQDISS